MMSWRENPGAIMNWFPISSRAGVTMVEAKGERKANRETRVVAVHFRPLDQFNGFSGSSSPFHRTLKEGGIEGNPQSQHTTYHPKRGKRTTGIHKPGRVGKTDDVSIGLLFFVIIIQVVHRTQRLWIHVPARIHGRSEWRASVGSTVNYAA